MKFKLLFLLLFTTFTFSYAQFEPASYMINGTTLPYQIMYPKDYDSSQQYPLLVFLHGSGERGDDNLKQLTHGKEFLINNFQTEYPAIVIVPQCPTTCYWVNIEENIFRDKNSFSFGVSDKPTPPMETLVYLINYWIRSGKIDKKQIYVGGLSMGGMGTYELLWRMPNTFAAAFPICGGGDLKKIVENSKKTALWIFHGADDDVVPVKYSQDIYSALTKAKKEVKYTEYPNVNHDSWNNALAEEKLVPWLFKHRK